MNEPGRTGDVLLRADHISKRFGATQALDNVSVEFFAGEVHALMGENGAGKSTLGKVIAGLHAQDSGRVTIHAAGGVRVLKPGSLHDAFDAGVRLVHQELAQCPNLSIAENLTLHDVPRTRLGLVDRRAMVERASALVHRLDPSIDVGAPLGPLSPGRRQICQIAACLDEGRSTGGGPGGAKVIVLDEPTSSLSASEAERLLEITRQLASHGITVIYVSHRMGEIFSVCDRVTVLRDGKYVATSRVKELDEAALVEQMIGRRLEVVAKRAASGPPESSPPPLLRVSRVSSPGKLEEVSLEVRPGEIVGVGGLVGCGRSELLDAIFGLDSAARGEVVVSGTRLTGKGAGRVRRAIGAGIGYVPEDRRQQGLFFQLGIDENIVMPFMARIAAMMGVRRRAGERSLVEQKIGEFRVKAAGQASLPGELSGGNQQKLLLARWMGGGTRVLLLDEPTRGIDVGTKSEIHRLVRRAADEGAAVLLVSSEMPELLALADRVLVMREGRISGELTGEGMTQTEILRLATATTRAA